MFPLLYPVGELHLPSDIGAYGAANPTQNAATCSVSGAVSERFRDYSRMTWGKVSKRSFYTENILLESVGLLQQLVLKTATNVRYMKSELPKKYQTSRNVEKESCFNRWEDTMNHIIQCGISCQTSLLSSRPMGPLSYGMYRKAFLEYYYHLYALP